MPHLLSVYAWDGQHKVVRVTYGPSAEQAMHVGLRVATAELLAYVQDGSEALPPGDVAGCEQAPPALRAVSALVVAR
jgi:hypothetical protein